MLKLPIWILGHLLIMIESAVLDDFFNELSLLGIVIQRPSLNFTIVDIFWMRKNIRESWVDAELNHFTIDVELKH